jgi:excinuclease ABC subunit B
VTTEERIKHAAVAIEAELATRLKQLRDEGRLLEAQRLEQRTRFDLETLATTGFCQGIENYSRHLTDREPGDPPATLLDYFPDDFLLFVDESHITVPQVRGMFAGDRSRKQVLVDYGFRLPSALDNRPLNFTEFERHIRRAVYVSATPGPWELGKAGVKGYDPNDKQGANFTASLAKALEDPKSHVAQQVIRPTGLLDPVVEVRPSTDQVKDVEAEIKKVVKTGVRVLVTVMTKRTAEELAEYLLNQGVKVQYLHSEVDTLERLEVLTALRRGDYDVLVGINLLREGLDLPEVGLVAILDADKEGFLRSDTSLVQTMGRAARHVTGRTILYADKMTGSMERAIGETNRRRKIQEDYNREHGITPAGITKAIKDMVQREHSEPATKQLDFENLQDAPPDVQAEVAQRLEAEMELAAQNLEFEKAASLRDQLAQVERLLGGKRPKAKFVFHPPQNPRRSKHLDGGLQRQGPPHRQRRKRVRLHAAIQGTRGPASQVQRQGPKSVGLSV